MVFTCFAMLLAAQTGLRVKFQGPKPTVTDFAWTLCNWYANLEETGDKPSNIILQALKQQRKGLPLEEGAILDIDEKNGYLLYEQRYNNVVIRMEMCYWNEADGRHKLFAFNDLASTHDGRLIVTETSGITFWRYNNKTKRMTYCDPPGFDVDFSSMYALPRIGKDIVVTAMNDDGTVKSVQTLKWNGRKFVK